MRAMVERVRNAEDILYVKVAADRHVPPSLFVITVDPIFDTGTIGLHSKKGHRHQDDRSIALDVFGYNDSFWSSSVVLPPGTQVHLTKRCSFYRPICLTKHGWSCPTQRAHCIHCVVSGL